ncbi:MAG: PQQ-binding-like beta-propeller repeat protein [Planctomycetaceae bacterium]
MSLSQTLRLGRWLTPLCMALAIGGTFGSGISLGGDAETWPRFRGHNGEARSDLKGVPSKWSDKDYEWVVEIPGKGHSSPVVWKDKLFVMSGQEDGIRTLYCFNSFTGERLWSDPLKLDANHLHLKNSYGSGTPAVDDERVYCSTADESHYVVSAYTHSGEKVWNVDLGPFTSEHGQGVSPIIHGELLIVSNDQKGPSSLVALNRKTGEQVWKTERAFRRASYATPFVLEQEGKSPQLICLCGNLGLTGHDLADGRELWTSGQLPMRTVASPVHGNGVVLAVCGAGGKGTMLVAVDPNGSGDVSAKNIKYTLTKGLPYVPTPIVVGDYLFLWNDDGVVRCMEVATGSEVWTERVGGKFSGSPVLIDGRLFAISEDGVVSVIAASNKFELLGQSPLGDPSYATPAVANGRVYLRSFSKLACLKAKAE